MTYKCPAHYRCHNNNKRTTSENLDFQNVYIILLTEGEEKLMDKVESI